MSFTPDSQRFGNGIDDVTGERIKPGIHERLLNSLLTTVRAIDDYEAVIAARLADGKNWSGPHLTGLTELREKLVKRRRKLFELMSEIESFSGKLS